VRRNESLRQHLSTEQVADVGVGAAPLPSVGSDVVQIETAKQLVERGTQVRPISALAIAVAFGNDPVIPELM